MLTADKQTTKPTMNGWNRGQTFQIGFVNWHAPTGKLKMHSFGHRKIAPQSCIVISSHLLAGSGTPTTRYLQQYATVLGRLHSAEAGFAVAEAALIAALAPIGLGAAAAVLRIGAKTIDFGSPLVRISVRATRTPRAGRLLDPDHETHEVDFDRPINTDTEPVGDERRIMGEENQGNVSRTQDAGPVDGDGEREGRRDNDQDQREDVWEDGSYRNPNDPEGIRRTADGEMMIQNKDGTWRPVSAMSDPNMIGGDDGRRHNPQVGRWGETVADNYAKDQGWEKISGPWTTMDSPFTGPHRLDGVYRDPGPPPRYIIPDAKGLNSPQSTTKAGVLQMSKDWITPRLAKVGLERAQLRELTSSGYHPVLLRVDKNGKVTETWLDDNGNPIPAPSWRTEE